MATILNRTKKEPKPCYQVPLPGRAPGPATPQHSPLRHPVPHFLSALFLSSGQRGSGQGSGLGLHQPLGGGELTKDLGSGLGQVTLDSRCPVPLSHPDFWSTKPGHPKAHCPTLRECTVKVRRPICPYKGSHRRGRPTAKGCITEQRNRRGTERWGREEDLTRVNCREMPQVPPPPHRLFLPPTTLETRKVRLTPRRGVGT